MDNITLGILTFSVSTMVGLVGRYKGKLDQAETNFKHLQKKYDLLDRHVQMETQNWNFTRKTVKELRQEVAELQPQKPRIQT